MRVFRKRQLRLREDNIVHLKGDSSDIPGSLNALSGLSTNTAVDMTFNSGSSENKNTVFYNPDGKSSINPTDAKNTGKEVLGRGDKLTFSFDDNGRPTSGNGNTNESRFSGNLIEGAVMFSKRELRDFLRKL